MKADLDRLMAERNIDVVLIRGTEGEDADRFYITNGIHASAMVIKKQGETPIIIVNGMELEEAQKSGLDVHTYAEIFNYAEVAKASGNNPKVMQIEMARRIFDHFDVRGRLAVYGTASVMGSFKYLNMLQAEFADRIELVEDEDPTIFTVARRTKDADELEALRESGRRSSLAMTEAREWISTMRAEDGVVVNANGNPVTIGDVKRYVRARLMEHGMEDNEGMIFAQGRDAGFPHSRGEEDEALKVGQAIVFDLFPRPIGGGYYHDMTRTWSIGEASEEVVEAHRLVMHAFTQSLEGLSLGQRTRDLQELVCDILEDKDHPTPRSKPGTSEGYVHSLGHGLGLNVHEAPGISNYSPDSSVFEVGDVVTIEPGLYYPDKGWGIRIEDTVYITESGELDNLTDCTYDLIIPLNG